MVFIEFLAANALTFEIVMNFVSALKCMFGMYGWLDKPFVKHLLKGINYTAHAPPSPRSLFTLLQVHKIFRLCGASFNLL